MIQKLISSIPEDFKRRQIHMNEESSLKWFDELPQIIKELVTKWELSNLILVEEMSFNNILFYANSPEHGNVIVKIGHPAYEIFFFEPQALKYYEGKKDVCKLYDLDSQNRAMLLECLNPGESISKLDNMEERIRIASNLLIRISKPLNEQHVFPSYEDMMADYFQRVKTKADTDKQLLNLISIAEGFLSEIISERHVKVLVHGDYHYRNIILSENVYKVIDPKGMEGFKFMDTAQLINNEMLFSQGDMSYLDKVIGLISKYTGYNIKILSKWLFIECVWRIAGNVLYVKSSSQKISEKIKRSEFYLEYYRQS